jgi:starvation-inducible DNA-binding protein
MSNTPVTTALKTVLADSYALALKTQNYHWNVEGRHFPSLHPMFETQYDALFEAVDTIAERIRALGEKAPGSFAEFAKLSKITDANSALDENAMVKDLHDGHVQVAKSVSAAIKTSQKAGDEVTADIMTSRLTEHDKTAWMLKSSLKQ